MTFDNLGPPVFAVDELGHVALPIADMCEPFGAFGQGVSLSPGFESRTLFFENIVKQLFRRVWSVDFLNRFQQVHRELVAVRLKKIMAPARKPVDHLWAAHLLRATPGIEITVALEGEAMLLDAHVAHLHFFHELVDGHSPGALERVNNVKPLSTANFRD